MATRNTGDWTYKARIDAEKSAFADKKVDLAAAKLAAMIDGVCIKKIG